MQSRPVLDRQEHVLNRSKCGNLMLTLRSCISNKFLTSCDKYLNFTPNYFKLNSLSDDITFVYVNCAIVIGPEHPIILTLSDNVITPTLCHLGRPFVLEILDPHRVFLSPEELQTIQQVNHLINNEHLLTNPTQILCLIDWDHRSTIVFVIRCGIIMNFISFSTL